jgi:hypothetical protein
MSSITLGTFTTTEQERRKLVIHLERLTLYKRSDWDERPWGGSSSSSWRIITVGTVQRKRKTRPITDITSTYVRKEEIAIAAQGPRDKQTYTSRYWAKYLWTNLLWWKRLKYKKVAVSYIQSVPRYFNKNSCTKEPGMVFLPADKDAST